MPTKAERVGPNVIDVRVDGITAGWEMWVLLRSDVHHDNPKCDQALEKKHLDEAQKRGAVVIDNGDLFCAMQGKYDKRASKSAIREEHLDGNYLDLLVETAADFYKPYNDLIWILGRGNHETAIRDKHETDLTDRLAALMAANGTTVLTSGYSGWVRFMFTSHETRRESVVLHHYHGTGGGGPVTRGTIQTSRISVDTPDAHIILTGHTHDEWIMPIARQRISARGQLYHDECLHVRPPGYKDAWGDGYSGWEVERRLGPKPKGSMWLRFWYEAATIRYDVMRAK